MLTAPLSTLHSVTFDRWRQITVAHCTCGWMQRGTKAEVYNAAAVHDLDQWEIEPRCVDCGALVDGQGITSDLVRCCFTCKAD